MKLRMMKNKSLLFCLSKILKITIMKMKRRPLILILELPATISLHRQINLHLLSKFGACKKGKLLSNKLELYSLAFPNLLLKNHLKFPKKGKLKPPISVNRLKSSIILPKKLTPKNK